VKNLSVILKVYVIDKLSSKRNNTHLIQCKILITQPLARSKISTLHLST